MKSIYLSLAALSIAALVSSCAREELNSAPSSEENLVNITVIASEKPEAAPALETTRTYLSGTSVKWNGTGEYLQVFEEATPGEGDPVTTPAASSQGVTTDGGSTMNFGVSFAAGSASSYDYYALYPSSAYQSRTDISNVAINTPYLQTPTSSSYDPAADLLIAKPYAAGDTQPTSLDMQFARMVAIAKMTVKNLSSSDDVEKITFTAVDDATDVTLAGRTAFNLSTGMPRTNYGSNIANKSIMLDYSGIDIAANDASGMVAYFTCFPFSLAAGDKFTVVVETATHIFTKVVNLTGAQTLVLKEGKSSVFSVDMDGIPGVAKAVNLPYAYLDFADYNAYNPKNTYSAITVSKTHGDRWETYAAKSGTSISLRNPSSGNDSYIKLPDFVNDIKTVVVTLSTANSGKTLTLESTATDKTGTIASITTDTDLEYTFDVASKSVKTAYLRSTNFNGLIAKVEVYSGTDTRAALAAPASVTAELNDDDVAVTNSIDVAWEAAANATGYRITLTPSEGDPVVVDVASNVTSRTVTGLAYSTSYTVGVQTLGDVYEVSSAISASRNAASAVVTGAAAGAISVTYTVSSKTSVSTTGVAPLGSSATYSQTYNGTAGQMTASKSITLTISGYDGKRITGASVMVHSNAKAGAGNLSLMNGTTTIASIGDSTFDSADWNGAYTNSFVAKDLTVTPVTIANSTSIVLTIAASTNSLFFESLTLEYE